MPSYLMKAEPDTDFYVIWSTVVDAPTDWGPREELAARQPDLTLDRFARADANGSSLKGSDYLTWADTELYVSEGVPHQGTLQRCDLIAFCAALDAEDEAALARLIVGGAE